MPCYHPIKAFARVPLGERKREIVFATDADKDASYVDRNGHIYSEKIELPCGQCLGCRLEYSRQWAMRCVLEAKQWPENYFVTLTYDPEFVPIRDHLVVNTDTGEVVKEEKVMTLRSRDLTLFIKRFRMAMKREYGCDHIRYFACGEYGSLNERPHYHIIFFNCPLEDLKLDFVRNGYAYFRSKIIEKCWPFGFSNVTEFSFRTAAYVARYMLKKHKGKDRRWYEEHGVEPEFSRCSRRPGLGREYFEAHKDEIYRYDSIVVSVGLGKVMRCTPPKYFDRIFDDEDPDRLDELKLKRMNLAKHRSEDVLSRTDLSKDDYLLVCEDNKLFSASKLVRSL